MLLPVPLNLHSGRFAENVLRMYQVSVHQPSGKLLRKQLFAQLPLARAYFESLLRVPQPQAVEVRLIEQQDARSRYLLDCKRVKATLTERGQGA